MKFLRRSLLPCLAGLMAAALSSSPADAQFIPTISSGPGVYRFGETGNWNGAAITGVFNDNAGVSTIVFHSTDVVLSSGLSFTFANNNTVNLESVGGRSTLVLGGDVSMNNATTAMMTIGSADSSSALDVDLHGARTFNIAAGNLMVLPNVISGSAGLTKAGAGTLKFTGTNTYTGGTTVTGGILQFGDVLNTGSVVGDATDGIQVGSGAAVSFSSNSNTSYDGVISGAGQVIKDGSAQLTVTADNTYSGGTVISDGVLDVGGGGSTGSITGNVNLSTSNSLLRFDRSDATTISYQGIIQGSGNVEKQGPGTLTFNDAQTYTGQTYVGGGTLTTSGADKLSPNSVITVDTGATLAITAANTIGGLSNGEGSGIVTLGANLTLNPASDVDVTFSGVISGAGALVKSGQGTQKLTGTNTYTGGTILKDGTLVICSDGQLGATAGVLTFDGGTLRTDSDLTLARNLVFTGAGTIDNYGSAITLSAPISGSGAFTATGTGTITLAGANASFTGSTAIADGCLTIGAVNALGTSSAVSLTGYGTLNLEANQTIGSLSSGSTDSLVNFNAGEVLTINTAGSATFSGTIGGNGSLVIGGTGSQTLGGANTYTGTTSVTGGSLVISNGSNLGSAASAVILDGGALKAATGFTLSRDLQLNASGGTFNTNTFQVGLSGVISGSGSFKHQGAGILTLSGTNTFTGGTTITGGGVLDFTADANLGATSSGVTLNGGFLRTQAAVADFTHAISLGVLGGNLNTNGFNSTFSGAITGAGNLNVLSQSGNGILTLTNPGNTYTGETFVSSGTLSIGSINALPTTTKVTIASGATLDVAFDQTVAAISSTGTAQIASGKQLTVNATSTSLQFDGVISGAGVFVKDGPNTFNLYGANTYSGGTILKAGTLILLNANALGASGTITFGGGTLQFNATNTTDYSARFSSLSSQLYNIDTNGQNVTFGSAITSPGGTLTKLGSGTLTLSAANSYTGGTTINGGNLVIAANGALPGTGSVVVNAGATLQVGTGGTVGIVSGNITNDGTVLFNRSDASTYAGVISGPSTGVVSINGTGVTTFTGANTYAGTTIVGNNATLALANAGGVTLASSTDVSFGSNSKLDVTVDQTVRGLISSFSTSLIAIAAGKTLTSNVPTGSGNQFAGILSGTGSFTKDGPGTLTLTADQPFAGNVTVAGGILQLGNGGTSGGFGGNIAVNSGASLSFNRTDTTPVSYSGIISGSGGFTKSGSSTLVLGGVSSFSGDVFIFGGTLKVGVANAVPNVKVNVSSGATLDVANNTTISTLSGLGSTTVAAGKTLKINAGQGLDSLISGAGNVELGGVTTMLVNQAYTGSTTVKFGTLNFGNGGTVGSVAGDIVLAGADGVIVSRSNALTYAGVISGAGFLNQNGAGTLTLTGTNTYTGSTAVLTGTLKIGAVNALPVSTTMSISDGATLQVAANQTIARFGSSVTSSSILVDAAQMLNVSLGSSNIDTFFGGAISGLGGLRIGPSTLGQSVVLVGNNSYTGGTIVDSGGTLRLGSGTSTGMIVGNVLNNGALVFERTSGAQFDGIISGAGSVSQGRSSSTASLGEIVLTGANTYTGGTQVYRGRLFASNTSGSATGTGVVTVQSSGLFGGSGSISGSLSVNSGGAVAAISNAGLPATLSVGSTTFSGGGKLLFGISNANGVSGTDYSLLSISGSLAINATATAPFKIALLSFTGANTPGQLTGFNGSQAYSWTFLNASGGITGFNAAAFTVDASSFSPGFIGSFGIAQSGNDLLIKYSPTAVPEPSTWALLVAGLATIFVASRRNRRLGNQRT